MRYRVLYLLIIIVLLLSILVGCVWVPEYPPINTSYEFSLDDTIPFVDIDNAPTSNQSRGFRGEAYINLGENEAYPGKGLNAKDELIKEINRYEGDDIRLIQLYVYIGKFYNGDITKEAFDELRDFLELIHDNNFKVLLRFAYETGASTDGPRTADIERHLLEIKTFISNNLELFNTTIYAVQMGLIGLWGEGHGAHHNIDVKRVAIALADAIPQDIPLMVRTPEMLRKVPKDIEYRFGVHDDYMVGYSHKWGMMDWNDENYPRLLAKCKYALTDAEMPWGKDDNSAPVDMMGVVGQCVGYGLTSMSIAHNYKENGGSYELEKWKGEYLTREMLDEGHYPYNPNLLKDGKISVYNYLKYHLGYQLVASNLSFNNGKASFMLTNFGFAMPHNYDMNIYVDGVKVPYSDAFDAKTLTMFGQAKYTFEYNVGSIAVELVNKRDSSDKIRLFNDIEYDDGFNIIYK